MAGYRLLLEDGSALLLENGSALLTEAPAVDPTPDTGRHPDPAETYFAVASDVPNPAETSFAIT